MITHCINKIVDGHPFVPDDFHGINNDSFCNEIIDEGIASLFYPLLSDKQNIPSKILEVSRKYYEAAFLYKDYCLQKLKELQPSISKYGRIVLIQGFALLDKLYQEPYIRTMSDIDLYLPDGNIKHVRTELIKNGFYPYGTYRNVLNYKGLQIDLHEDLWGQDRVSMRRLFAPKNKIPFEPSTLIPGCYCIPLPYLLFHSMFHAMKHAFNRKIWYVDLLLFQRKGLFSHLDTIDHYKIRNVILNRFIDNGYLRTKVTPTDISQSWNSKLQIYVLNNIKTKNTGELLLALSLNSFVNILRYLWSAIFLSKENLTDMYGCHMLIILYCKRICVLFKSMVKFIR